MTMFNEGEEPSQVPVLQHNRGAYTASPMPTNTMKYVSTSGQ